MKNDLLLYYLAALLCVGRLLVLFSTLHVSVRVLTTKCLFMLSLSERIR